MAERRALPFRLVRTLKTGRTVSLDMPAAVTFDLDDTLAVLDGNRTAVLEATLRSFGVDGISRDEYLDAHRRFHANATREPIFAALLEDRGIDRVDPGTVAAEYRRRIRATIRPIPGADRLLDTLGDRHPLGLVTNGPARAQRDKLDRLGWADRFDAVVISGRLGVAKPEPAPFLEACRRLGVDAADVVHVGDHPVHDVRGARDAGLTPVHVGRDPAAEDAHRIDRAALADGLPRLLERRIPS